LESFTAFVAIIGERRLYDVWQLWAAAADFSSNGYNCGVGGGVSDYGQVT